MKQPWVYMCSPSWSPVPPPSPPDPSRSSQCTRSERLSHASNLGSSLTVAKVLEFQLQHQSYQWTPRTDLLYDGLVGSPSVQGTLKSLQHHSSKTSILQHSAIFIVQFSHPYVTTGKTIALTRRTFVDKVMSLLFNMLSRLVMTKWYEPNRSRRY